ncbi:MAG: PIN domain-containing protein [Candidatus Jettenia sp.]|uniref:PIN domain-containing protein n=1 Tax=Candidatus Jettenia caeni TaxID=247490 RepID=I3IKA3_9BACT|nr:PIN domain-containing protein [Candidatus Jettenia sp. AMX1]MBC6929954.1 PIN domain-containing protein [Candidatus Jettenia sp.]NUN23647.1 PIN domain-containing protein [Candidatus Jettenia caeni]KAA0248503.1 MAG: PIN domain-containing protein [Candidatus Jettenia sp. AMX1]MCE7881592.1 PIN domain-containing protein [Candidatus Jettenia sp. AMX1]MCQ3928214.1 PIN domain-containing protein [Candidatus Jettenia sp.]
MIIRMKGRSGFQGWSLGLISLKDQKDDMVLELAVTDDCDYIVTHNIKHFQIWSNLN